MESCANQNFVDCQLGDKRLDDRALEIGKALVVGFGQALSMLFQERNLLKRAYEFFANPKVQFGKIAQPHWENTAKSAQTLKTLLAVGDTTFLNYNNIKAKRDGYGPIGNGGNGLILHSTLAVEAELGQPLGLLWQKLWHREPKAKPPICETAKQKKARLAQERKARREQPFEQKESYRWVEAQKAVNKQFQLVENHSRKIQSKQDKTSEPATAKSRIIHIFDREGDIAEVFDQVLEMEYTGVVVRAAHDRCLEPNDVHLWQYLSNQPIQVYQEVELPATAKRTARKALLAVRFSPIQLRSPRRLNNQNPLKIYAVYAQEIEPIDQGEAICWMLLTTDTISL
jgi:hypothetical protein